MIDAEDARLQLVSWSVCCDFHDDPAEILAHLKEWEAIYGFDEAGRVIVAPDGWSILPYRTVIPHQHCEFYNGRWLRPRLGRSTMTPIWAKPCGKTRAYAVPTSWLAGKDK